MKITNHKIDTIGTRHGEKLYEALLSTEEKAASEDLGNYYRIPPDARDLNYRKFVEEGEKKIPDAVAYTSHNTTQLDVIKMERMLADLPFMQKVLSGKI
jgi:UDP-glucose 4-epimerase